MKYLIQYQGYCGNAALWWRPNRSGYTTHIDEAGQYDEAEARSIERMRGLDKAWPATTMFAIAHKTVDADQLFQLDDRLSKAPFSEDANS